MTNTTADRVETFCAADEMREKLRKHIKATYKFQSEAAAVWKCSPPFVNAIMRGHRDPPPFMLEEIGYEKVKGYSWKPTAGKPALLVQVEGALLEPASSPIKILWLAADTEDHRRVTVGLRASLRIRIDEKYGNRVKAAEVWDCSPGLVSHVLSGSKLPTEAMLSDLGLQRITGYRQVAVASKDKK